MVSIFDFPEITGSDYPSRIIDFEKDEPDFDLLDFYAKTELAEGFRHIEPKFEEEDEDALLRLKAKLYRFDKDGNHWKERGVGILKLLKHKETKKIRFVMRQAETLKLIANHLVLPTIPTLFHVTSRNALTWHASDFSDGELKQEVFCARFARSENANLFRKMFVNAIESQVQKYEESKEGATH